MGLISGLFGNKKSKKYDIVIEFPSWAGGEKSRVSEFAGLLKAEAHLNNIPENFVAGIMTHPLSMGKLFAVAGRKEREGASFDEQMLAVLNQIKIYWSKTTEQERSEIWNGQFQF